MALRFSIIVPVYNVEAYLEKCILSILAQKHPAMEIILVDDGSTDGSPAICDDYAARFDCIRVIHKRNGGLSSARNAGLEAAQGEYIWFVDSDDWIEAHALGMLEQAIQSAPDIVKFGYYRPDGNGTDQAVLPQIPQDVQGSAEAFRRQVFCEPGKVLLSAWSHLYSRAFIERNQLRFVSERQCGSEDYLWNLTALLLTDKVSVLRQPLYHYEIRGGSLTHTYKPDLDKRYTFLYDELMRFACQRGLQRVYSGLIQRFYVWHLIFGTCFSHEYLTVTQQHVVSDGRIRVKEMMRAPQFRRALIGCDRKKLPLQKWIHWIAMVFRIEPYFFWLFVRKRNKQSR